MLYCAWGDNMNRNRKRLRILPLILLVALSVVFAVAIRQTGVKDGQLPLPSAAPLATGGDAAKESSPAGQKDRPGSKEAVVAYIQAQGKLPDYYITKRQANKLGWTGGSLEAYAPGKLIGGDRFGNYEGLLPQKAGRVWTECDIDTWGKGSRGAKRIVFSSDGLIYYTDDHYASFDKVEGSL